MSSTPYLEDFGKWNRQRQNYNRGVWWWPEPPQKYGITFTALRLPIWADFALGYNGDQNYFSAYNDGDWYDGIEHDAVDSELIHKLNGKNAPFKKNEGFLFWKQQNRWSVYKGDGIRMSSWMELRIGKEPDREQVIVCEDLSDQEATSTFKWNDQQQSNQEVLKKRLLIYLNNIRRTENG